MEGRPVPADLYTERYFKQDCGGMEFFSRYGPKVLKPSLAYSLSRAELASGMSVLDIGCGRGEILFQALQAGARGVGTDYAPAALGIAREVSGCPVALCDAKSLPFADSSFDRIFFIGVMDHLHEWELERCFAEMARVLKPGGFVIIHTCANREYYKVWTYGWRQGLAKALRKIGFSTRDPEPPRSGRDFDLHVNEHSAGQMRAFFRRLGWDAEVEPRPNYKLMLTDLYGETLPEDFPMKPTPRWRARLYLWILFWGPFKPYLARELFAVARPPSGHAPSMV